MELALMADIRIAGRRARLLFTGEVIDAARAERIGLVGRVVEDDRLLATALEVAGRIAANPPLAVAALKRGLRARPGLCGPRRMGECHAGRTVHHPRPSRGSAVLSGEARAADTRRPGSDAGRVGRWRVWSTTRTRRIETPQGRTDHDARQRRRARPPHR
jgi:hypothetical protein